ncbi:MAG: asparagine synthase-related protein, partial [Chloroflexia bacterium]
YYCARPGGGLVAASEIKAIHAAGIKRDPDTKAWATYLTAGLHDHSERTFWAGVKAVPAGHYLTWKDGNTRISEWYNLAAQSGIEYDSRPVDEVEEEYLALLTESVRLRFRSDVPVGINLSGGLDSSLLLGLVHAVQGPDSDVSAYTFATSDVQYDELPWVRAMLEQTHHPSHVVLLQAEDVPELAESVHRYEDEPFGGIPTLAYAKLFEAAREQGTKVILDGQGMDEQWAGYSYYAGLSKGGTAGIVQGTQSSPVRPECLAPEFRKLASSREAEQPFPDKLRNVQYRDIKYTKIPRALRFNDRASMRSSIELREPFLDHLLLEVALRQPAERKIVGGVHKWLPRKVAQRLLPKGVAEAPKRPVQTPQREWLRGPLQDWATMCIESALAGSQGEWFDKEMVRREWRHYLSGAGDNSFFVWQWVSLGLMAQASNSQLAGVNV